MKAIMHPVKTYLHICHTQMIEIIKQILMLHKVKTGQYKMQTFQNEIVIAS